MVLMCASKAMAREIEAKVKCTGLAAIRRRLVELGARRVRSGLERNVCFDTPESALYAGDSLLRLRKCGPTVLTYKGPRANAGDKVKSRVEIEVEVGDFEAMRELLAALGFVKVWAYEKKREEWKVGKTKICLDTLPRMGTYVEVEGKSEGELMRVLRKLGIARSDATSRTYAEIWRDFVKGTDWRIPDMVFDRREGR